MVEWAGTNKQVLGKGPCKIFWASSAQSTPDHFYLGYVQVTRPMGNLFKNKLIVINDLGRLTQILR